MYHLYYKTSFILYVKKIERVTWNCITPSGGFRPSDKGGGGGVIHTRIEGGPGLKNFVSALRASVWSKKKREASPAGPSPGSTTGPTYGNKRHSWILDSTLLVRWIPDSRYIGFQITCQWNLDSGFLLIITVTDSWFPSGAEKRIPKPMIPGLHKQK